MALDKVSDEEAVSTLRNLLDAAQEEEIPEARRTINAISSKRRAELLSAEPELGHKFVDLMRRVWPAAGERTRYEISLSAEALMYILSNEQAERFGLPAVLMLLAGCGTDQAKGSIYTIMFRSSGRPDPDLRRMACRIMIPMEADEVFLCKAAAGLHRCRTEPWLLELAPILNEKLGPDLFERAVIEGLVYKPDRQESEVLKVLTIIEPKLRSENGQRFLDEVKKGKSARDVLSSMMQSGEWQKARRRQNT
jgi:hypothetical protein